LEHGDFGKAMESLRKIDAKTNLENVSLIGNMKDYIDVSNQENVVPAYLQSLSLD